LTFYEINPEELNGEIVSAEEHPAKNHPRYEELSRERNILAKKSLAKIFTPLKRKVFRKYLVVQQKIRVSIFKNSKYSKLLHQIRKRIP
jgi:hypothetical protein